MHHRGGPSPSRSETVRLDGKFFSNCRFENCVLHCGGERCEWKDTNFFNCQIVFDGAANNTVQVLRGMGFSFEMRFIMLVSVNHSFPCTYSRHGRCVGLRPKRVRRGTLPSLVPSIRPTLWRIVAHWNHLTS